MSKLSSSLLLFFVAALCLASSVLTADLNTEANTKRLTVATALDPASVKYQIIYGKEKDDTFYINDEVIVLIGYDRKVPCTPTVQLELTPQGVSSALTHARYTTQKRDMTIVNSDDAEIYGQKDNWYQAYRYRVKAGDLNSKIKSIHMKDQTTCNLNGVNDLTFTEFILSPSDVKINTIPARIVSVTSHQTGSSFAFGGVIDIAVHYDRSVLVEPSTQHNIRLKLNTGGYAKLVGFAPGSPALWGTGAGTEKQVTTTLLFQYIVKHGEETPTGLKLDVVALELRGNRIITASSMLEAENYVQQDPAHKSSLQLEGITVTRAGYKFPPFDYDKTVFPDGKAKPTTALPVNIGVNVLYIGDIDERNAEWDAKIEAVVDWVDLRFKHKLCNDAGVTPCTDETKTIELPYAETINKIWNPEIITHNTNLQNYHKSGENRVTIRNDGRVTLHLFFEARFWDKLNARNYPYEGMLLRHILRSAKYDHHYINIMVDSTQVPDAEDLIRKMNQPQFHVLKHKQGVETPHSGGLLDGYTLHTTTVTAKRRALHANMTIVFPIIFILGMVFSAYYMDVFSDAKYIVTALGAFGTLIINYSVLNNLPQANYVSRLGILLMFNYIHILYTFLFFIVLRRVATGIEDFRKIQECKRIQLLAGIHSDDHKDGQEMEKKADASATATKTEGKGDSTSTSKPDIEGQHAHKDNCCDEVKVFGFITLNAKNIVSIGENLQVASGVTGIIYFCFTVISTAVILAVNISGN